ncbi:FecR family protein [Maribacter sedimenticola]|uniref:FecR family protein n=1 Tax=Maribacter sedimenticola TaxID=228956 RepID=A0ABY1SI11_9FLAO|nr:MULTISPECIES: FecR family protein [Maribacter]TVZ14147.1 FecR family protein [Maribacter sp. MAR_2009_72]SNR48107.1 FecR family protein [Maribacter sedimenticola]
MKNNDLNLSFFLEDASFENWARGLNKNDIEYWNLWIRNNPQHIETVESAKSIILGVSFVQQYPDKIKVDHELAKILPKLAIEEPAVKPKKSLRSSQKIFLLTTAAIFLILLSWNGLSLFNNYNTTTHKTNFGEIIDLKLPDGTSVVLNGNSKISYNKNNPRLITLDGEAYFKVKSIPSTNAKFWVLTEDLKVEVLGTQFHVNTRKKKTNVVLDEGSIHLEFNNGTVTKMIPGELVSFSKESENLIHKKVSVKTPYALWRGGTYAFNEIPLKEVMFNIENTYGIKVLYSNDSLKNIPISGGIPNQNLKICIAAIEKATGTRIIHKNDTLQVTENPINN